MTKVSVLIVDDSEIDCYLLERDLEKTKYTVHVVKKYDGVEALNFFKDHELNRQIMGDDFPPLIVFLDVNMPKMDGLEFLEKYNEIRASLDLNSTVVMMFTSSKNPKDIEQSIKYDFVCGYLVKGEYKVEDLDAVLGNL